METRIYSLGQRCLACILLFSFFLQSCGNQSIPKEANDRKPIYREPISAEIKGEELSTTENMEYIGGWVKEEKEDKTVGSVKEGDYSHSPKRKHSYLDVYPTSQPKKQKYEEELEQEKDPKRILKEKVRRGNDPEVQFELAQLYESTCRDNYGSSNSTSTKAIKWYQKAASNGHEKSQNRLKQVYYVPIDDDLLGGCIRALYPSYQVNSILKTEDNDYKLKLSDITFMDLDRHKVPAYIELCNNHRLPSYFYNPLYSSNKTFLYEDAVLAVDPSTRGDDETAYCIAKRSKDRYFVTALKGYEGGYKSKENRKGDASGMWKKIAKQVIKHGVKYVHIEGTSDNHIETLKAKIEELGRDESLIPEIYAKTSSGNKESRIMGNLLPFFQPQSVLVMDRKVLMKDFKAPIDRKFKWFYQLTNLTLNREKWVSKSSCLHHDDRIDAFSMAVKCLLDRYTEGKKQSGLGDNFANSGRYEQAKKHYEEAKKKGYCEASPGLALIYYEQKNYHAVRMLLEDIEAKGYEENFYWVDHTLGAIYLHGWGGAIRDEAKANDYFKKASQKEGYKPPFSLGIEYYKEKKYQLAWENFKEIEAMYRINPQWVSTYRTELGQIFCNLGYIYNEGLKEINERLEEIPKDLTKARTYFEEASKLGCQEGSLQLGKKYYEDGNYSEAEKLLEQVLASGYKDQDGSINYALGIIYQKEEEIEKAKNHYEQAYKISPKNKNAALKLGLIYYKQYNNEADPKKKEYLLSPALKSLESCLDVPKPPVKNYKKHSSSNDETPIPTFGTLAHGLDITKEEQGEIYKILSTLYEKKAELRGITFGLRQALNALSGEYDRKSKELLLK